MVDDIFSEAQRWKAVCRETLELPDKAGPLNVRLQKTDRTRNAIMVQSKYILLILYVYTSFILCKIRHYMDPAARIWIPNCSAPAILRIIPSNAIEDDASDGVVVLSAAIGLNSEDVFLLLQLSSFLGESLTQIMQIMQIIVHLSTVNDLNWPRNHYALFAVLVYSLLIFWAISRRNERWKQVRLRLSLLVKFSRYYGI